MESIINNSLHIVLNNFDVPDIKNIILTEVETGNPTFADAINAVLDKNIDISVSCCIFLF